MICHDLPILDMSPNSGNPPKKNHPDMSSNLEMTGPLGAGCSEATGALGKKTLANYAQLVGFFCLFLGKYRDSTHMSYVYIYNIYIYIFMILFMYIYIYSL